MNIVYTYYEDVPEITNCPSRNSSQQDLIEICSKSWANHGWNLLVLSEKDAATHPLYESYKKVVLSFPSANPFPYDYHCYMRWLAMANVGGGIMIDYDVVNLGVKNLDFFDFSRLTLYQGHVPCVVSGNSEHYLNLVKEFIKIKDKIKDYICLINDKPHTSDMLFLASGDIKFNKLNKVENYPKRSALVHCCQYVCNDKNKFEIMKELLQDA
jgi:hypothetical protein